jgi:protein-tyrosine phosphatase
MDGRKIRPGLLFRSGDFYSLSREDQGKLEGMGLSSIIDFRSKREKARRPDPVIGSVREVIHIEIHDAARDMAEKLMAEGDGKALETVLIGDYIRMVHLHQEDFRKFFKILAHTENLPLVYHCVAGKDRTGLATVFLLTALGVDFKDIRHNYMETNEFTSTVTAGIIQRATEEGMKGEILRPLLEVRNEYLDAALAEIEKISGTLQDFVAGVLKADKERLCGRYLDG